MTHEEMITRPRAGTGHRPMLVHFGNRHSLPGEVCDTCSDPASGYWVPVVHCAKASASTEEAYTYGVLRPEPDEYDCVDRNGDIWPEHDFLPYVDECRRCGAEGGMDAG